MQINCIIFFFCVLNCLYTFSQPTNNTCANATDLNGIGSIGGTLSGATYTATFEACYKDGDCSNYQRPDVWYKFTASNTSHTVSLSNVGAKIQMVIYNSSAGGACPADDNAKHEKSTGNNTYFCYNDVGGFESEQNYTDETSNEPYRLNLNHLTIGKVYYLQIINPGYGSNTGTSIDGTCNSTGTAATFTLGTPFLPVKLGNFECLNEGKNQYKVLWNTLSETNSDYFILESSINGYEFQPLSLIKAQGNSNKKTDYSYSGQYERNLYFRLKQIDIDGKYEYFGPIYLTHTEHYLNEIKASYNENKLNIFGENLNCNSNIKIIDITGKEIQIKEVDCNNSKIKVLFDYSLNSGVYLLFINNYSLKFNVE